MRFFELFLTSLTKPHRVEEKALSRDDLKSRWNRTSSCVGYLTLALSLLGFMAAFATGVSTDRQHTLTLSTFFPPQLRPPSPDTAALGSWLLRKHKEGEAVVFRISSVPASMPSSPVSTDDLNYIYQP